MSQTPRSLLARAQVWDGSSWVNAPGDAANGLDVDVTRLPSIPAGTNNIGDVDVLTLPALPAGANSIGTVDTELPAAAALSDADANPTTPSVGACLMGWDGTQWRRGKVSASGVVNVTGATATTTDGATVSSALPALAPAYVKTNAANTWDRARGATEADGTAGVGVQGVGPLMWDAGSSTYKRLTGDAANGLDVDVTRLPALPAGTNNIGDVDVLTMPAVALDAASLAALESITADVSDRAARDLGLVRQGAPAAQANAWYFRPRQIATYSALYRLASRPYPLSYASGGAGRKQVATVFHAAGATKTIRVREVLVLVRSISAAAIVSVELVRLTNATTPATGNPAITPQPHNPADTVEATCLALPTTAGTEAAGAPYRSWQFETAAVTPAAGSTAPPLDIPWKTLYVDPFDPEELAPTARSGNAEGVAVVFDANASVTITGLVKIRFTEE